MPPLEDDDRSRSLPQPLISVQNVSKRYTMGQVVVHALRNATIDILTGEFIMIIGPSGSGKSTLLNIIGGMDTPTEGEVLFQGKNIARANDKELTAYRRREIGFVFQFFNLIPTLTALENVQVACELSSDPMDATDALDAVGLSDRADHFPSQLSGGQQQRVAIARALASNPRLILCDEPTGALDTEASHRLLALLTDLKSRLSKTIVFITHNTALTYAADRVASIHDGAIESIVVPARPADRR